MNLLDWLVIGAYAAGMIGLSTFLGRGQTSQEDYYVGGRGMPWRAIGLSTMATQTSAISFISIPAFVALKPGGGLTWLQYEIAVPLAMIGVAMLLLPFFRRLGLISIYEYLEYRFDASVRDLLSGVFLVSRALGTGVGLYASAIVLTVALDLPLWATILAMGAITIVYDTIGGIKAVVYSDVIQSFILVAGIFLAVGYGLHNIGGIEAALTSLPPERWRALDTAWGLGDGSNTPFWGFLIGGFFLYMSYYGADQSQVQRELSAVSVDDTRRSLYLNGFARFPLTLGYIVMGVVLGAFFTLSVDLQQRVPQDRLDFLVPAFILLPDVFWMWWNFTGMIVAVAVTTVVSRSLGRVDPSVIQAFTLPGSGFLREQRLWRPAYTFLTLYFVLLLGLLLFLNHAAEDLLPAL